MTRTPPTIENGTVPPRRVPYAAHRTREHLTPSEIEHLIEVARKRGRYGHRDATMILLAYRHGLRVSELVALRWDQVDLKQELLQVNRLKRGTPSTHPLRGPELRSLRQLERDFPLSFVCLPDRAGRSHDRGRLSQDV
jgi:integrase